MSASSWFFVSCYILITALTFYVWLQPEPRSSPFRAGFAATLAVMFFLSSFALGVWIAVLRSRGQLWIL